MEKKKPKKYSFESSSRNEAREPMAAYGIMTSHYMSKLASLTVKEIEKASMPGKALLDVQEETDLSAMEVAVIVGVSKSKYYDLVKLDHLDAKEVDALADFANLWQRGLEAFDNDRLLLNEWLNTRNENLGGIKPIELLGSRMGKRTLEKAFLRIEYSTYG